MIAIQTLPITPKLITKDYYIMPNGDIYNRKYYRLEKEVYEKESVNHVMPILQK